MSRADRLAERIAAGGLDAFIVGDLVRPGDSSSDATNDIRWLTGFTGTSGIAIIGPELRTFLTDFRYTDRAKRQVDSEFDRITFEGRMLDELAKRLSGEVGFDDSTTSVRTFEKLAKAVSSDVKLVARQGVMADFRRSKDDAEVEAIAEASRLCDEAFELVAGAGLEGKTELEVARVAQARMRELGAEPSFPAIVGAGPNGALPHAEPSDRVIGAGELVVVDMGAKLGGYCSDGTRTFATGNPGAEASEVYELVLRAQEEAIAAIGPGFGGAEADAIARDIIEAAGHGERFGHGLGHGVGLEVHEAPRLGKTSEDVLAAGDVVTVEPGVYVPGKFGVRIEDLVAIDADGIRNLSTTPKALRIVG